MKRLSSGFNGTIDGYSGRAENLGEQHVLTPDEDGQSSDRPSP